MQNSKTNKQKNQWKTRQTLPRKVLFTTFKLIEPALFFKDTPCTVIYYTCLVMEDITIQIKK